MHHNKTASQTQADIRVQGQIDPFFSKFCIGSLFDRCGIRKRHSHGVRSLIPGFLFEALDAAITSFVISKNRSIRFCANPES